MTTTMPKWSTPNRQALLVKLFLDSGGFCVYGHKSCAIPSHHYEIYIENLIDDWKADDREQASFEWKLEQKRLHSLGEPRLPVRGRFSAISKVIWHDKQPLFYVESLGMDCLKLKPFARVKLSSSYLRLYVDLGDSLRGMSKNKKRKAIRYRKSLPTDIEARVSKLVALAIEDYLNH